ncbi:MAG: methyltransferase, partial [Clostridia bacterium]|nr:methyltransferase [Clostridia bacterium]
PPVYEKDGFTIKSVTEVKYKINLESAEDIEALFKMTPYYYKTSAADQEKLKTLSSLEVSLEFAVTEYVK